jgi:5-methylcytosine-specific restriction endonuclease McrA
MMSARERKETTMTTRKNHRNTRDSRSDYRGVVLRKDLRLAIYLRDHFTCLCCLRDLTDAAPADLTLDHVTPASDGGSNDASNLYLCCRHCNCSRQDKPLSRAAGLEAVKHIRRNCRRSIRKYRTLAKAIIAGTTEDPRGNL